MSVKTFSEREFASGSRLLQEATERLEEASRVVARESAEAPHLTRRIDSFSHNWRPPAICSMEELTTAATEIAGLANQVAQYAAWLRYEGEAD